MILDHATDAEMAAELVRRVRLKGEKLLGLTCNYDGFVWWVKVETRAIREAAEPTAQPGGQEEGEG